MELIYLLALATATAILFITIRMYERITDGLRQENARLRIQLARVDETREAVIETYQEAQRRHPCSTHGMRLIDGGAR